MAEIILGKRELKKIYIIFSHTHNNCQIIPECTDSCHTSPHPFTPPTLPLHLSMKLTLISNTFHTCLMTVTLPDSCHTSKAPVHLLNDHHNFLSNDTPVYTFHISLTTVRIPDNLHLPHDHHTFPSTETNWQQLSHLPENCHTS